MEDRKEFIEVQKFRQWWFLLIVLLILLWLPVTIIYQHFTHQLIGNHPASNTVLLLVFLFVVLPVCLFLYRSKLTVRINDDIISYGFNFTSNSELKWADVKDVAIIKYRFWGAGYKISSKYGDIYNTGGDIGLQITKVNGGKILLGTRKPLQVEKFLKEIGKL